MNQTDVPLSMQSCLRFLLVSIGASLLLAPSIAFAQAKKTNNPAQVVDRVVAIINDDVILSTELMMRVAPAAFQLEKISDQKEKQRRLSKLSGQVLDEMINEKLVSQAASVAKLTVSAKEVTAAIEDLKKQNKLDDKGLEAALKLQGYSVSSHRKDVKEQIMRMRAVNTLVRSKISVSDEDVQAAYDAKKVNSNQISQVKLRHILVAIPADATDEVKKVARNKATEILEKAKQGEDFVKLAEIFSDDSATKNTGGELGWLARGTIATEWEVIVFAMEKGETRGPVSGPHGLHIFQVTDTKDSKQKAFEVVKEKLRNQLYRIKLEKQTRIWVANLRKKAHFEVKL